MIARYRELPSIERYSAAIDPRCEPDAACSVVLAAFDAASLWTDVLATAWRARYPAWSEAIDAAIGASSLDVDPHEMETLGQRLGPVAVDGLGRYELIEHIGRGSSGRVFRAVDHVFAACGKPAEVAVKLIPCAADEIAEALREAGHARRISHGGVARVLDAGRIDSTMACQIGCGDQAIFVVQEFVHGQPLWIWKACHPERGAETCQWIVANIGEALEACHSSGISHGDLTPANVLIEPSGRTRIIDFGGAVRDLGRAEDHGRRHDHQRLEAIRGWLLRDLRRTRPGLRHRHVGIAVMALVGLGILAAPFLPKPSRSGPGRSERRPIRLPAPNEPLPDSSLGEYRLFKQDGRVILIPGGIPDSGQRPSGQGTGTTSEPSIESILLDDPGMMTIKISDEKFKGIFGEPTGEVSRDGLAVYRIPKERLSVEIAALDRGGTVLMPSGNMKGAEAPPPPPTAKGESPQEGVPREESPPSPESCERDAFISVVFGDFPPGPGREWRLALARSVLLEGPVDNEDRDLRIALADRIKQEAEAKRQEAQAHPGLELLAAMAFLSADVNSEAIRLALQATGPTMQREQRDLAEIVQAIATARMGIHLGGVVQAEIEEFSRRHAAPGLMRLSLEP